MRRIVKTHPPIELTAWREENRELNHSYKDMLGTEAHKKLKEKLLKEQGWLCAYTGKKIENDTSHVEHLKPQTTCDEWEDVDYKNVVACFPADGGDITHGYGAPKKGGWWEAGKFISPLVTDCERRFKFSWSGHVSPNPTDHPAAKMTIDVLRLDEKALQQLRKSRIDGFFGFGTKSRTKPLSKADAKIVLANIDRVNEDGQLREFCFVLKQLLPKYIAGLEAK
ncbi:retron system putative HNH endonuclease [Aeromonas rivipollensis]|uniref:retron system putative HNH endonuclease n=1 Tax=Aeromonas rivipollensis TaxID=948519 RepID=UPI00259D4305|nr:retron system putative HNH endonuclease [Aeromonas rivipollensis]MDM5057407.1 TIGR02646 family protein [Aeromonas rivipollensis]